MSDIMSAKSLYVDCIPFFRCLLFCPFRKSTVIKRITGERCIRRRYQHWLSRLFRVDITNVLWRRFVSVSQFKTFSRPSVFLFIAPDLSTFTWRWYTTFILISSKELAKLLSFVVGCVYMRCFNPGWHGCSAAAIYQNGVEFTGKSQICTLHVRFMNLVCFQVDPFWIK